MMKVKELIEMLKEMPEDDSVWVVVKGDESADTIGHCVEVEGINHATILVAI